MFFPLADVDKEEVRLYPVDWNHVVEAFQEMKRHGTTTRASPLTASSVYLNNTTKMGVAQVCECLSCQSSVGYGVRAVSL
jgi:phage terminase small subunit